MSAKYEPVGVVHRGERFDPDGDGGIIHRYMDGEVIHHYRTAGEFIAALDESENDA